MPYKDPIAQAKFQNEWAKKRRSDWIAAYGPCKCGETKELYVAQKNPKKRATSHFWTYSDEKRRKILRDCTVLCRSCRLKHWGDEFKRRYKGRQGKAQALTPAMVWSIRGQLLGRDSMREIARIHGLDHSVVADIQKGTIWSWLQGGRRQVYGIKRSKTSGSKRLSARR